ncbi:MULTISPECIES: hypothetical protein [Priestia]|uniref:Uncharacterized protein n=1 Tax=Priestia aryabhattai TaxID=412384 RepID=A0ABD7X3F6_PRIAR|nr:hypothetical protein [Priestia aryabhattai]WEA47118.1 hypothetical protein PWO00_27840 [Priestia aryabhattai]
MITKDITQSTFPKKLVALPTSCNDVVYYPAKLADLAIEETYTVFQTLSQKSGLSYLVVTQPRTAKIVLAGSKVLINEVYHSIPWPTYKIADGDNKFTYKESPSLQALEDYFIQLKEQ